MKAGRTDIIRVVKSMQTEAHQQRFTLIALIGGADDVEFLDEVSDALSTSETHIQALGHIIDKLSEP